MVGTVHFFNTSCTAVGPGCPVENSVYGYHPSLEVNAFLISSFACFAIIHISLGIWKHTYFFGSLLAFSCMAEVAGYAGRVMLHNNPYDTVGFHLTITCLEFAPSFLAAAVHATLNFIALTFGATTSILPPPMYTWMFIGMDMLCLASLAIGGALAGNLRRAPEQGTAGYIMIVCGMATQILTLVVFAGLVVEYLYRTRRAWHHAPLAATKLLGTYKFKLYVAGVSVAYTTVLVRCTYRLMELAGGWPNATMHSEASFIVFESCMIFLATAAFTLFHPGFCFPLKAAPRPQRWTFRGSWTRPSSVTENRDDIEVWECRGMSCQEAPPDAAPDKLPRLSEATVQSSEGTFISSKASQGSLKGRQSGTCWYSIDSDSNSHMEQPHGASTSQTGRRREGDAMQISTADYQSRL